MNQKKKNIILIKMIGQIINSINLENCINVIKKKIDD